jgi:LysR family nitrogen assimilation transcriptional regulator
MELRQLSYFVGVSRAGSFSKAAAMLHVAQPALSRQVALLERELKVRLFTRNGRGVVPTSAGREFLRHATAILESIENAKRDLRVLTGASAEVRIGVPLTVSRLVTSELYQLVRAQFPNIRLQISEAWTGHIRRDLLDGKLDCGVISHSQVEHHMLHERLVSESVHLIHGPEYPMARRPVRLQDLERIPLVLPPEPHGIRLVVDEAFEKHGIRPNIVLESEVWTVVTEVVRNGITCTLLPTREVNRELAMGLLRSVPIQPVLRSGLSLARLQNRKSSPATEAFFTFMAQELRRLIRDAAHGPDSREVKTASPRSAATRKTGSADDKAVPAP